MSLRDAAVRGPIAAPAPAPQTATPRATPIQVESLRSTMAMLVSGVLISVGASFLPTSLITTAIFLVGFSLFLHGISVLLRYRDIVRERVLRALGQGKAIDMLKVELAKVRSGAQRLLVAIRKGSEERNETKESEGSAPPPQEKKAA